MMDEVFAEPLLEFILLENHQIELSFGEKTQGHRRSAEGIAEFPFLKDSEDVLIREPAKTTAYFPQTRTSSPLPDQRLNNGLPVGNPRIVKVMAKKELA